MAALRQVGTFVGGVSETVLRVNTSGRAPGQG